MHALSLRVDTYLRFAEAVNRLDIAEADPKPGVTELAGEATRHVSRGKTEGVLDAITEKVTEKARK
jgi:gas vesicle structural protein